jgi:hypothetical protein
MTARGFRLACPPLLTLAALLGAGPASAATIALPSGEATATYDDTLWAAKVDEDGDLYFSCKAEVCNPNSGFCSVTVAPAPGVTPATFFTSDFVKRTSAHLNDAGGKVLKPLAKATKGANTGMTTTLELTYDQTIMRVDYFLIGLNSEALLAMCAVAETKADAAAGAVDSVLSGLAVRGAR